MRQPDLSKLVFVSVAGAVVVGGSVLFGLYSGVRRNVVYRVVAAVRDDMRAAFADVSREATTLTGLRPEWFLQYSQHPGAGVTVDETEGRRLVLLAGFFEGGNQIRLIERDGSVVAKWPVRYSSLFPDPSHVHDPPSTDWNIDMHGTLIRPDGSVVFNFEHAGLVKLDRCGGVEWTLARETHHSVEVAEDGGYWVPGSHFVTDPSAPSYPPFEKPYYEDTILRVSENGEVLREVSAVEIFYKNGLAPILTATGEDDNFSGSNWDQEIIHLNKVGELPTSLADEFPEFEAGDLILSIRESNIVLVVDPATDRIKWWSIGPWVRQHDPDFEKSGDISVFNNNVYRTAFGSDNPYRRALPGTPRTSNIILMDPVSRDYRVAYGSAPGQEMLSVVRGKHQSTDDGGWLVTEHTAGRVFEVDADGALVWEYVNAYDDDMVAEITEARVYSPDYFEVADWTCDRAPGP